MVVDALYIKKNLIRQKENNNLITGNMEDVVGVNVLSSFIYKTTKK